MALGSLVSKNSGSGSLKRIIRAELRREGDIPYLTKDGYLRASAFAELCPREEVLCSSRKIVRKEAIDGDAAFNFMYGEAIHWAGQNRLFSSLDLIVGKWSCLRCATSYGGCKPGEPLERGLVHRPSKCTGCGTKDMKDFQYHEQHFTDQMYRIGGHPDGFLQVPGLAGIGIIEMKSISFNGAFQIKHVPNFGHAIQSQIYMWLTGLKWAKICYFDKGTYGLSGFIEHHVERDEETISKIKETVRSIWHGIETGELPVRICTTNDCPRAKTCVVAGPCFDTLAQLNLDGPATR